MWSKKRIVWFVLMIFTMAVIFYFSGQDGEVSQTLGNAVGKSMHITPPNNWIGEARTKLLFGLNLRKWAHIGLFSVLGLCAFGWAKGYLSALLICFGYALFDEIHQSFIPGRTASFSDVFIDAIGFGITVLLLQFFCFVYRRLRGNKR